MTEIQNVSKICISNFGIVSDFGFRASNLPDPLKQRGQHLFNLIMSGHFLL
jgi:hypothetical protein